MRGGTVEHFPGGLPQPLHKAAALVRQSDEDEEALVRRHVGHELRVGARHAVLVEVVTATADDAGALLGHVELQTGVGDVVDGLGCYSVMLSDVTAAISTFEITSSLKLYESRPLR